MQRREEVLTNFFAFLSLGILITALAYGDVEHQGGDANRSELPPMTPIPAAVIQQIKQKVEGISTQSPLVLAAPTKVDGEHDTDRKLGDPVKKPMQEAVAAFIQARQNLNKCEEKEVHDPSRPTATRDFLKVYDEYLTYVSGLMGGAKLEDKTLATKTLDILHYIDQRAAIFASEDKTGDKNLADHVKKFTRALLTAGDDSKKLEWPDGMIDIPLADGKRQTVARDEKSQGAKDVETAVASLLKASAKPENFCAFTVAPPSAAVAGGTTAVDPNGQAPGDSKDKDKGGKDTTTANGKKEGDDYGAKGASYPGYPSQDPNSNFAKQQYQNPGSDLLKSLLDPNRNNLANLPVPPNGTPGTPSGGGSKGGGTPSGGGGQPPGGEKGGEQPQPPYPPMGQGQGPDPYEQYQQELARRAEEDERKQRQAQQQQILQQQQQQLAASQAQPTPAPVSNDLLAATRTMSSNLDKLMNMVNPQNQLNPFGQMNTLGLGNAATNGLPGQPYYNPLANPLQNGYAQPSTLLNPLQSATRLPIRRTFSLGMTNRSPISR